MAKVPLLQPQRGADESRENYESRREAGHTYVSAQLTGTYSWNPNLQGTYINPDNAGRPRGKSAIRRYKLARRLERAQKAQETALAAKVDAIDTAAE